MHNLLQGSYFLKENSVKYVFHVYCHDINGMHVDDVDVYQRS